jgi:hypothetical protein
LVLEITVPYTGISPQRHGVREERRILAALSFVLVLVLVLGKAFYSRC